jgi:hypothetical protein
MSDCKLGPVAPGFLRTVKGFIGGRDQHACIFSPVASDRHPHDLQQALH